MEERKEDEEGKEEIEDDGKGVEAVPTNVGVTVDEDGTEDGDADPKSDGKKDNVKRTSGKFCSLES